MFLQAIFREVVREGTAAHHLLLGGGNHSDNNPLSVTGRRTGSGR